MQEYAEQELDELIDQALRSEPKISSVEMQARKARLLSMAAAQHQDEPMTSMHTPRWRAAIIQAQSAVGQWCYALLYEETCYDRARSIPVRRCSKTFAWGFPTDRYFFLCPAS
jgi:hypothetical protein